MNIKKASYIFSFATILTVIVLTIIVLSKDKVSDQPQQEVSGMLMQGQIDLNVENLALLCKIWGFMKYYHPEVRAGKYDWDKELFSIIPSFSCISSKEKRNEILTEWVNKFDVPMEPGEKIIFSSDSIKMYPDINWIEDTVSLGTVLSDKLEKIYDAERDTLSYYVRLQHEVKNAIFKHENDYPQCSLPIINYQLLALFRLWNAIQYYYPYKYLFRENWDEKLLKYIPLFLKIANKEDYVNALKMFIAEIHDAHAHIIGSKSKQFLVPVMIRFIEGKAIVTDYYEISSSHQGSIDNSLQIGDIILRVNNEPVDSLIKRVTPYISGSNKASLFRDIVTLELLWSNDKELYVDYERDGISNKTKIKCIPSKDVIFTMIQKTYPLITTLPSNILYLYMGSSIGGEMPKEIKEKGVIIDLRNYPSSKKIKGYMNYELLYPSSTNCALATNGSLLYPGLFTFDQTSKVGKKNEEYYKGEKVILVNEFTQSHAEFTTMRYKQAPNAIVMGSTTAGADGNYSIITLPGGLKAIFTGLGIYYPDKSETQQIGIVPDIEVKSTIQGIREGRDEVLEAAIDYINKKVATSGTSK